MISLLIALAPLIVSVGLQLIDWFVGDAQAKAQAKTDFLNAIQSHINDAAKSVVLRQDAQQEMDNLTKQQGQEPKA